MEGKKIIRRVNAYGCVCYNTKEYFVSAEQVGEDVTITESNGRLTATFKDGRKRRLSRDKGRVFDLQFRDSDSKHKNAKIPDFVQDILSAGNELLSYSRGYSYLNPIVTLNKKSLTFETDSVILTIQRKR